jgi:putative nucleotidyltransferase with HDIG domain
VVLGREKGDELMEAESRHSLQDVIDFYLAIVTMRPDGLKEHSVRVAILAAKAAVKLKLDARAAYVAGILHDVGKIALPCHLFDGHEITDEEYADVRSHVKLGFEVLKGKYLFTALVAGFHHALGKSGYGLTIKDFPDELSLDTVKKILDIAALIAICDYVDAAITRDTIVRDGSSGALLREALEAKYPNSILEIDTVMGLI